MYNYISAYVYIILRIRTVVPGTAPPEAAQESRRRGTKISKNAQKSSRILAFMVEKLFSSRNLREILKKKGVPWRSDSSGSSSGSSGSSGSST